MNGDEGKPSEPTQPQREPNPTTHPEPTRPVPPPTPRRKNVARVLMDTEETAEYLGVAVQTLHNWRSRGEGPPYVKLGRRVRYDRRVLDRWLDKQTVGAA